MAGKKADKGSDNGGENSSDDLGASQVQEMVNQEQSQGFRGTEVDTTPNENYTLSGVVSGKPVPETSANPVAARAEATAEIGEEAASATGDKETAK